MAFFVRKPITLNSLRAVLTNLAVAVKGETACIDTATGLLRPAVAGVATLRAVGTFTESITGDGSLTTVVALFEEVRCQEWLNDAVTPVTMPGNRCDPVFMKDGRTVTADSVGNAIAGIALDIDSTGRVIVATRPFFVT